MFGIKWAFWNKDKKTKNKRLLALWDEWMTLRFPDLDVRTDRIVDDLMEYVQTDSMLAGYIQTYIFYGKYSDGRNSEPRLGIINELAGVKRLLSSITRRKYTRTDVPKVAAIVAHMKEQIRIAELVLQEER